MNNSDKKCLMETDPHIAAEWDYENNNGLAPQDVTRGSHKKVAWKCPLGHSYVAEIKSRTIGKQTGCPYCAGIKVLPGFNDLLSQAPDIAKQFSSRNQILPSEVLVTSRKKYIWECEHCANTWEARPDSRLRNSGCPFCSGRYATIKTCLATVNPKLAEQLHPVRNGDVTAFNLTPHSNKKVWWVCPTCRHEYQATVSNRSKGRGCPECAKHRHTSFPEQAVYYYVRQAFAHTRNGYKVGGKELDVYIPDLYIAFEHNGMYYHLGKEEADLAKIQYFKTRGVRVITIKEGQTNLVDGDVIEYCYRTRMKGSLDWMVNQVLRFVGVDNVLVDVNADEEHIKKLYIPAARSEETMAS
jgi:Zn finger protein HypA/HybF involved in hydrogenase expression